MNLESSLKQLKLKPFWLFFIRSFHPAPYYHTAVIFWLFRYPALGPSQFYFTKKASFIKIQKRVLYADTIIYFGSTFFLLAYENIIRDRETVFMVRARKYTPFEPEDPRLSLTLLVTIVALELLGELWTIFYSRSVSVNTHRVLSSSRSSPIRNHPDFSDIQIFIPSSLFFINR